MDEESKIIKWFYFQMGTPIHLLDTTNCTPYWNHGRIDNIKAVRMLDNCTLPKKKKKKTNIR